MVETGDKMRRKLLVYLTSLILVITFVAPLQTQAVIDRPDFDRDHEVAKEFGDNRAIELIDRLNKDEREILENKIKDNEMFESINTDLRLYQAQHHTVDQSARNIDSLFQKAEKTPAMRFVYLYKDAEQLGMFENKDIINDTSINMANFGTLRESLEYGIHSDFIAGDLVRNNIRSDQNIVLKLKVPADTRILYTGESQVVLERNQGIKITNWRLAAEGGRQVILADAEIVS